MTKEKAQNEIKVNKSKPEKSWRLVYTDKKEVLTLLQLTGITQTIHNIFEAKTKEECFDKITELKLKYDKKDYLEYLKTKK
jgi:hypothetical protein